MGRNKVSSLTLCIGTELICVDESKAKSARRRTTTRRLSLTELRFLFDDGKTGSVPDCASSGEKSGGERRWSGIWAMLAFTGTMGVGARMAGIIGAMRVVEVEEGCIRGLRGMGRAEEIAIREVYGVVMRMSGVPRLAG